MSDNNADLAFWKEGEDEQLKPRTVRMMKVSPTEVRFEVRDTRTDTEIRHWNVDRQVLRRRESQTGLKRQLGNYVSASLAEEVVNEVESFYPPYTQGDFDAAD